MLRRRPHEESGTTILGMTEVPTINFQIGDVGSHATRETSKSPTLYTPRTQARSMDNLHHAMIPSIESTKIYCFGTWTRRAKAFAQLLASARRVLGLFHESQGPGSPRQSRKHVETGVMSPQGSALGGSLRGLLFVLYKTLYTMNCTIYCMTYAIYKIRFCYMLHATCYMLNVLYDTLHIIY